MTERLGELEEIKDYQKLTDWQYKQLDKLEQQKEKHLDDVARYEQVSGELELLLSEKDDLQLERDSLREEWEQASFEEDYDALEELRQKRQQLDNRIDEIESQHHDFSQWLTDKAVDRKAVAKTIAETLTVASAEKPSKTAIQKAVEEFVRVTDEPINRRQWNITQALYDYVTRSELDAVRREVDGAYKKEQENKERRACAERELAEEVEIWEEQYGFHKVHRTPKPMLTGGDTILHSRKANGGKRDLLVEGIV